MIGSTNQHPPPPCRSTKASYPDTKYREEAAGCSCTVVEMTQRAGQWYWLIAISLATSTSSDAFEFLWFLQWKGTDHPIPGRLVVMNVGCEAAHGESELTALSCGWEH